MATSGHCLGSGPSTTIPNSRAASAPNTEIGLNEREIKSAVMAVQNGITSLTRIAAEQGRDVEEVFKEIKSDEDLANSMGLTLGTPQNIVAPPRENE